MRDLPVLKLDLSKPEDFGNVAEKLGVDERRTLATDLIALVKVDETSMNEWLGKAKGFLDQVKKTQNTSSPQNREQEGANEEPPPSTEMMLSAAIQFSARATDALLGEPDLCKASEPGAEPLAAWVSSQLRSKDPNWAMDTDPLIFHMSITGLAWRKRDFDTEDKEFHSGFCNCTEVIINANVRGNGERAPRITHQFERYPYEIERSIERGRWVDYEPVYNEEDPQAPKKFYETDAWLDLDGDEIDEPWTLTISLDDIAEIVRIRPRWSHKTVAVTDDALFFNPVRRFFPYKMIPDPDGGFFPVGFGELLDRMQSSADNLLGSIVETAKSEAKNAGVLSGGGFGLPSSAIELKSDTIVTINTDGAPLSDRFQAFPMKQVSPGSVSVLEKLIAMGGQLAGSVNVLESIPASTTATVAKGIIDSNQQVQSAVHRRLVMSMTLEFRDFVRMADAYDQLPQGMMGAQGDMIAVTADPQLATEMQRTAMAGIYKEMLQEPGVMIPEVLLRMFTVMRLPNPEKLIAPPQQPQATPFEKIKGYIDMEKAKTDRMKVTAGSAVQLTQALLNMVTAAGGMQNNRAALLTMAQLEQTVKQLMDQANDPGSGPGGMAAQPGDAGPGGAPPAAPGGSGDAVPAGPDGGAGGAGPGGGAV
jgi:chaperonin GroES